MNEVSRWSKSHTDAWQIVTLFDEGMRRSGEVGIECTAETSWHGEEKLGVEEIGRAHV